MEIFIFNSKLERIGTLEKFKSLIWIRRYNKPGEFELEAIITQKNLRLLKKNNIIYKMDDDKREDGECGYIEFRQLKSDIDGSEFVIVKGKFLTAYTQRRIIWNIENINLTYKESMQYLVRKNCIDTVNTRKIPKLEIGENNLIDDKKINYQISYSNLCEELEKLSLASELGYKIIFDVRNNKLKFIVYKGLDRSVDQDERPKSIFSLDRGNILEQEYVESINNLKNCTLIAGEGEGTERKITIVGDEVEALQRWEVFTDARDISSTVKDEEGKEIKITSEQYLELLKERGRQKLSETKEINTFESKINTNVAEYKKAFDLGDIATCLCKPWGVKINVRITEVEEVYEPNGVKINVTFGNNIPTLLDKIKQKI